MRHAEPRLIDALITEYQQVQIEGPRPPSLLTVTVPAVGPLDLKHGSEQRAWAQTRSDAQHPIEISALPIGPHGLGLDDGRNAEQFGLIDAPDRIDPRLDGLGSITEVRTDRDVGLGLHNQVLARAHEKTGPNRAGLREKSGLISALHGLKLTHAVLHLGLEAGEDRGVHLRDA